MQNPIGEADLEWILHRNCEGTEQLRYEKERQETPMSDFDRKDWDQDSKGPENIESNRKEQDPDRYKEVTDAEKTIVAEKEEDASVTETEAKAASDQNNTEDAKKSI